MIKLKVNTFPRYLAAQKRDPRYVFVLIISTLVLLICSLQVLSKGLFDSVERPIFQFFNGLPHILHGTMLAITQFGGLGGLFFWMAAGWYLVNRRAAFSVLWTSITAWILAKIGKGYFGRGRPLALLHNVNIAKGEIFSGNGFPSGHATFSAACATVLYYQVPKKYRKYILGIVLLVGISRMYLGAHFPLDVVGGWALGAFTGSAAMLIFGVSQKGISLLKLRHFLERKDYKIQTLKFANVDARGSKPIFLGLQNGDTYFGKIFGVQEHAADWLFKIFRFFRYKNLQAEEPYANSRRNIEIESFAMLWAKEAGVRVPKLIDLLHYGSSWLLLQRKIDAIALSDHGHILQESLNDAWKQVSKLHAANIAHRDLRAANLMIDTSGKAWIIDFGFAEVSASRRRIHMDNAELLMSMSLVAGVKRTVEAAIKESNPLDLKRAMPYLQKAVFSGETTKQLKQNNHMLAELRESLKTELDIKDEVVIADIQRVNLRKTLNIGLVAVFIYVIAPQFSSFKNAFGSISIDHPLWIVPLLLASLLTYIFTGSIYVSLADVPLKIRSASLVQLAASFMSKVLPGGIGGTSLNAKYLTKSGMEAADASAVIATQGVIGFAMFSIPLALFLFLNGTDLSHLIHFKLRILYLVIAVVIVIILALIIMAITKLRQFVFKKLLEFVESIRNVTTPSRELGLAALSSLAVTLAYITCLYASFRILGVPLGINGAVLVYATAVIAKSAVPTPGGLGPLEAAMIAAMIGLGVGRDLAFSAVIIYRLATFWIPIPFSLLAYKYINSKKLI